jgi:hypothetical protein
MRITWAILGAACLAGCATHHPAPVLLTTTTTKASAALAFDPPMTLSEPRLDLSRDTRGNAAFAGFEDTTTTYYYVRTDDRQTTDFTDRFQRDGYSAKVGSLRR